MAKKPIVNDYVQRTEYADIEKLAQTLIPKKIMDMGVTRNQFFDSQKVPQNMRPSQAQFSRVAREFNISPISTGYSTKTGFIFRYSTLIKALPVGRQPICPSEAELFSILHRRYVRAQIKKNLARDFRSNTVHRVDTTSETIEFTDDDSKKGVRAKVTNGRLLDKDFEWNDKPCMVNNPFNPERRIKSGKNWVPFKKGTKLIVTNCAGRKEVGFFEGYKGTELGILTIAGGKSSRFGRDAKLELASEDAPLSEDNIDLSDLHRNVDFVFFRTITQHDQKMQQRGQKNADEER